MEEIINEYVKICRLIGPWTDWVQGQGGNISIKDRDNLIVKASGELIGNTTSTSGWVICNIDDIKKRLYENNENIADKVILGKGKPSIETFLHTLPKKYIVHLHPSPLLNFLCNSSFNSSYTNSKKYKTISYFKPGIQLANSLYEIYNDSISIYFMKNHGVLFARNTLEEILEDMQFVSDTMFTKSFNIITPINTISNIWKYLYKYNNNIIIKSYMWPIKSQNNTFIPYTPDICVFLQEAPLVLNDNINEIDILRVYYNKYNKMPSVIYTTKCICTVSNSIEGCNNIYEILNQYLYIDDCSEKLSEKDVNELINWDKEKERKNFASMKTD